MKLKNVLEWEDQIKGGKADKKQPSDFDQKSLMKGIHVEFEHSNDILTAMEIAMDHLVEDPNYYEKLSLIDPHGDEEMKLKLTKEDIKTAVREAIDPRMWSEIVAKLKKLPIGDRELVMQNMLSYFSKRAPSSVGSDFIKNFKNPSDVAQRMKQQQQPEEPAGEPDLKSGGIIPANIGGVEMPKLGKIAKGPGPKGPEPETLTSPGEEDAARMASKQVGEPAARQYLGKKQKIDFDPSIMKALKKGKEPKFKDTGLGKSLQKVKGKLK